MDPKTQARLDVNAYLDKNTWLAGMSVFFIIQNVHIFVPAAASQLEPSELQSIVGFWRSMNGGLVIPSPVVATPPATQLPASPDSKLVEAVKKAVTTVTKGVDIKHGNGKINIGVSGVTAELTKGDAKLSAGISWGQTLKMEVEKGDFHFSGELANDHWKVELTYPEDTAVPDLSTLGKVFGEGEKALKNIASATAGFKNLSDITTVKNAISPNIKPVQDAVEAVQGIAKASPKKKKVNFGISLGSPDPLPGQSGIPPGVQVKAVVTFFFN